jgi:hypothetical protein
MERRRDNGQVPSSLSPDRPPLSQGAGSRMSVFGGYRLGAVLMVLGGSVAWRWGIAAERKPLEAVARPLTFIAID